MTGPADRDRELDDRLRDLDRMLDAVVRCDDDDESLLAQLEEATSGLQALLAGSIASASTPVGPGDLEATVGHVLRDFVPELGIPIVVRQHLCGRPLPVNCSAQELHHAVHRALVLCTSGAAKGATLDVATREDGDHAVLLVACDDPGTSLPERSVTLRAFAAGFDGRCSIRSDERGGVHLSLSFPLSLERR